MFTKIKLYMKKLLLTYFLFFFGLSAAFSQEITGKVIHFISEKGIADVAIQSNKNFDTTSDKFGNFKIDVSKINQLTFSYLGFETKTVLVSNIIENNFIVSLKEVSTELNEIEINTSKITLDSLLAKTARNMEINTIKHKTKRDFYTTENTKINFKNIELDLKSSSLLNRNNRKLAANELNNFSKKIMESNADFSTEFVGKLKSKSHFVEKLKKPFFIKIIDSLFGFRNVDDTKSFTINNIEDKMQQLILKYLNKEKSYKIKSGLFKVEDSISLKRLEKYKDSVDSRNTFTKFKPESLLDEALKKEILFENEDENNFLSTKYYEHQLAQNDLFSNHKHFVILFSPRKSKSKFTGKIYINPADFSVSKVEYQYAKGKRGQHLNLKFLLGIKFSEDIKKGEIHFKKNTANNYYVNYFKESFGNNIYANRPFKFIENSEERNKVKFNLKIEFSTLQTIEVLFQNVNPISSESFKKMNTKNRNKRISYITAIQHQNSNWKNKQLIYNYLKSLE